APAGPPWRLRRSENPRHRRKARRNPWFPREPPPSQFTRPNTCVGCAAARRRSARSAPLWRKAGRAVRTLVTGGGGFLGSHLVERLEAEGDDVFVAHRRDYDLTRQDDAERLFDEARP